MHEKDGSIMYLKELPLDVKGIIYRVLEIENPKLRRLYLDILLINDNQLLRGRLQALWDRGCRWNWLQACLNCKRTNDIPGIFLETFEEEKS